MIRVVSMLAMLALAVVLPAVGCRKPRPTPASYSPVGVASTPASVAAPAAVADEWVCSMHPNYRLPQPGKCSICGMDLVHSSELSAAEKPSPASGRSHSEGSHSKGSGGGCCG